MAFQLGKGIRRRSLFGILLVFSPCGRVVSLSNLCRNFERLTVVRSSFLEHEIDRWLSLVALSDLLQLALVVDD